MSDETCEYGEIDTKKRVFLESAPLLFLALGKCSSQRWRKAKICRLQFNVIRELMPEDEDGYGDVPGVSYIEPYLPPPDSFRESTAEALRSCVRAAFWVIGPDSLLDDLKKFEETSGESDRFVIIGLREPARQDGTAMVDNWFTTTMQELEDQDRRILSRYIG